MRIVLSQAFTPQLGNSNDKVHPYKKLIALSTMQPNFINIIRGLFILFDLFFLNKKKKDKDKR